MTTITNPTDLHPAWGERFNAGDAFAGFVALGLPINLILKHSLVVGDIALLVYDWTITGTSNGNPVNLAGTTADVARRGADGWRLVLDNPFGTA